MADNGEHEPADASAAAEPSAKDVGAALKELRRRKGITAESLGLLVEMSQPKISKIERGVSRPKPADVQLLATALGAPADLVRELVEAAARLPPATRRSPPRPRGPRAGEQPGPATADVLPVGAPVGQQDYLDEEGRAGRIQILEPTIVPGLLQTSEYTRRLINGYYALSTGSAPPMWEHTAATVALRAQRQRLLYDKTKTFTFVIMELVLLNRVGTPGAMLGQVDRIEDVADLPNVEVLIVPTDAELGYPPIQGFTILDGATVMLERLEALRHHDAETVGFYRRFFEHYVELGEDRLGEILDKYKRLYADQARPRPAPEPPTPAANPASGG
jgi:transcriptional regulator with XRE-family HTH domain